MQMVTINGESHTNITQTPLKQTSLSSVCYSTQINSTSIHTPLTGGEGGEGSWLGLAVRLVTPHSRGCAEGPRATKGTGTRDSSACRSQHEKPTCHSSTCRHVLRLYYFSSVNSISVFFLLSYHAFCPTCIAVEFQGQQELNNTTETVALLYDHTFQNINWINYSSYFSQMDIIVIELMTHKPTSIPHYFI